MRGDGSFHPGHKAVFDWSCVDVSNFFLSDKILHTDYQSYRVDDSPNLLHGKDVFEEMMTWR